MEGWPIADTDTLPVVTLALNEESMSVGMPPLSYALEAMEDGTYNPYRLQLDYYGGYLTRKFERSVCFEDPGLVRSLKRVCENQPRFLKEPVILSDHFSYYELGLLNRYLLEPRGGSVSYDRRMSSITDGAVLSAAQKFTVDWMNFIRSPELSSISSLQLEGSFRLFTQGDSFHYDEDPFQHLCNLETLYKASMLNLYISQHVAVENERSYFYESVFTCVLSYYLMVSPSSIFNDEFTEVFYKKIPKNYLDGSGKFLGEEI